MGCVRADGELETAVHQAQHRETERHHDMVRERRDAEREAVSEREHDADNQCDQPAPADELTERLCQ